MQRVFIIMGVSGSGKSTLGAAIFQETGLAYYDGDDFHPEENIKKMTAGEPLVDEDRWPWLDTIAQFANTFNKDIIFACSALKESYRSHLAGLINGDIEWIYLHGAYEVILDRLNQRSRHFMPSELLKSQFDTLEIPAYGLQVDVDLPIEEAVQKIVSHFNLMKREIGIIGLGVMGLGLARNLAKNRRALSLYNRRIEGLEEKVAEKAVARYSELTTALAFEELEPFILSISRPRVIILMIKAGSAVDQTISQMLEYLEEGDIILDCGNSNYKDTEERTRVLSEKGIYFVGSGVSGGEKGALNGPAIMPGGSPEAYQIIGPILESIAARDASGGPCCHHIGKGGAGHFVKMVHNGIEYGEMQLLAEMHSILRKGMKKDPDEISRIFESWQDSEQKGYLLEISTNIVKRKEGEEWLIDLILDKAGNKGTGGWTTIASCELGVPIPTITASLYARYISSFKEERTLMAKQLTFDNASISMDVDVLLSAYGLARLVNHHQGFHLISAASDVYNWDIQLSELARVWTNGCIIRSELMESLVEIFKSGNRILAHDSMIGMIKTNHKALNELIISAAKANISIPAFSSALSYLQDYSSNRTSANIIQAQRDYFGAHRYQRVDDPSGMTYHTIWEPED